MKTITFQDLNGDELTVQHDSGYNYRIYLKGKQYKEEEDRMGNKIPHCIHLNDNQAQILISALEDVMEDNE